MTSSRKPAAARWRRLVSDRLEEFEQLSPGGGPAGEAFWRRRAGRYATATPRTDTQHDPFLRRLRRVTEPSSTVIDVGAGTGRFALTLAPHVRHVTAVDPSEAMLEILRREARELGVHNLETVSARWADAGNLAADVVFSASVLTLVPDAVPFLGKLEAAARSHVVLYLGAYAEDAVLDPLWRHFHGTPRAPGPSYLDALDVIRELGIVPAVEVVEVFNRRRFATVDEAVEHYGDALAVPEAPQARRELAELLASWLLGRRGALRSPLRSSPAAIIRWTPGSRA